MDMRTAKEIFCRYDGSRFSMSRDGVEADYLAAGVPPDAEAAWLEELTCDKLRLLDQPGNWIVSHFLIHHADVGHLDEVAQANPKGNFWQRCAFVEGLLAYAGQVRKAGGDPSSIARAAGKAIVEAERLLKRARSADSIGRAQTVVVQARRILDEIESG